MGEITRMDSIPNHLEDPSLLPACEVQNLQGCKILEGHCQLDVERRVVSIFPTSVPGGDLDDEWFVTIDGDRLRLHGVARSECSGSHLRYDGHIGNTPPEEAV